ncbi:putative RNA-directed DNA polymerase [Helianthus debilis subsp. tardiflorus]
MWGEAVRHSTYLINKTPTRALHEDKTPYKMLKGKKPDLQFLKVFGCAAYLKIVGGHLPKLDDRSTRLIYLGSEKGSGAYPLYNPTTRRIVLGRDGDTEFDETRGWNWGKNIVSNDEESREPGMFWVDFNGVIDTGDGTVNTELSGSTSGTNENVENLCDELGTVSARPLTSSSNKNKINNNSLSSSSNKCGSINLDMDFSTMSNSNQRVVNGVGSHGPNSQRMRSDAFTASRSTLRGPMQPGPTAVNEGQDSSCIDENSSSAEENIFVTPDPVVRRSSRNMVTLVCFNDYVLNSSSIDKEYLLLADDEPAYFNDAKNKPEWMKAMRAEIESINKNNTWSLTELPRGAKAISLKWVFKVKRNANGSLNKHKARLVAKGYVQQPGVDFDEVFAPVARLETVRLLLSLAANEGWKLHHLDIKSAFLHGELKEEVYVVQPEGFVKEGEEHKLYKLSKALYGLRQAPRAWNTKLNNILLDMKFRRCSQEQAVYQRTIGTDVLLIGVYVDDLIATGSNLKLIMEFKRGMAKNFEMSDLGKLTNYLGIEVSQSKDGIKIKQESYAKKILTKVGMINCNPTSVPIDPNVEVSKFEDEEDIDATRY